MPFTYSFPIIFGVWPVATVVINDEIQDIKKNSLMVETRIEERSIAEFTIVDTTGILTFQKGQPVGIYDTTDTRIFGGVIDNPERVAMSPTGGLFHPIRCADWHYLADKRLIAESYLVASYANAGAIVTDIHTKYLAGEGITIGNIEAGVTIVEAVFNYVRASEALDALAEKSNKIWYIDENKALYFVARDLIPAPWNWTTRTPKPAGTKAHWSGGNPKYRNRQYIRGGRDITAPQTESFVADGEQNAFTCSFPLAKTPSGATGHIQENPPAADETVGIKGLDAPGDFAYYWNKGDPTIYAFAVPVVNTIIEVEYIGMFDILVLAEDPIAIAAQLAIEGAGTGYVDDIADEPKLTDKDASIDAAEAKLVRFAVTGQRFQYQTLDTGLKPGQLQMIDYPTLGLNSTQMLIESVVLRGFGSEVTHDITAIQGPTMGSWSDLFRALAHMKQEVIDRLNVGSEQILIILVEVDEDWGWDEEVVCTVFPCSVIGTGKVGTAKTC